VRKRARYAKKRVSASDSEESDEEKPCTSRQQTAKDLKQKLNGKDEPNVAQQSRVCSIGVLSPQIRP
jgi:hypothetical protein